MTVTDVTIRPGRECIPGSPKHQMDQKIHSVGCVMQSCSQGSQLWLPMRKPRNTNRKSELPPQHCLFLWYEHSEWQRMCNWPFSQPATCHSRRWIILEKSSHTMEKEALLGELLHCTKCSTLVTEVVAPALKEELREDIKGKSLQC